MALAVAVEGPVCGLKAGWSGGVDSDPQTSEKAKPVLVESRIVETSTFVGDAAKN